MEERGRDHPGHRKYPARPRPGDPREPRLGRHSSDPRDSNDILRDGEGRPLVDRYGRPVRRRPRRTEQPARPAPGPTPHETRFDLPPEQPAARSEARPRQYLPPRETPRRRPPAHQQPGRSAQHAPARHAPARRARRPRRGLRIPRPRGCLGALGLLLAAVLVLALAVTLWADSRLNRIDASPEPAVADTAGTNWLLVGSDSRQGLSEEDMDRLGTGGDLGVGRTDTIMLLHIPFRGESRLVSLPRDSYVSIPGYGQDKINAAFTYGGPRLLTATVEQNTGLNIDHYAEIGMGGLANVVDAVGGVELCLDYPINDPLANLDVQAGCQTMDGPTALGYVRTRATPQADLDRVQRQREFFGALIGSATSPGTLLNPFRVIPLVSEAAGTFTVGEGDHVWHLARMALSMRGGVETETVPIAGFADYAVGNVVLWDEAGAGALWDSMR